MRTKQHRAGAIRLKAKPASRQGGEMLEVHEEHANAERFGACKGTFHSTRSEQNLRRKTHCQAHAVDEMSWAGSGAGRGEGGEEG